MFPYIYIFYYKSDEIGGLVLEDFLFKVLISFEVVLLVIKNLIEASLISLFSSEYPVKEVQEGNKSPKP